MASNRSTGPNGSGPGRATPNHPGPTDCRFTIFVWRFPDRPHVESTTNAAHLTLVGHGRRPCDAHARRNDPGFHPRRASHSALGCPSLECGWPAGTIEHRCPPCDPAGGAGPASDAQGVDKVPVTVVTRLCLDELKPARSQREEYIGPRGCATSGETGDCRPAVRRQRSARSAGAGVTSARRRGRPRRPRPSFSYTRPQCAQRRRRVKP